MSNDHAASLRRLTPAVTRLLVVDDDPIQRRVISRLGVQAGHEAVVASSFYEATALLETASFNCITIDLGLGERSGVDLLRIIARSPVMMEVLIISGASEFVLESTKNFAWQNGLQLFDLFPKPLDLARLRDAFVRARLEHWRRQSAMAKAI